MIILISGLAFFSNLLYNSRCYIHLIYAGVAELADALDLGSSVNRCAGSSPVARTSMSVHNGFKLWTLILLLNFIRFVCGELVLCLLTFSLMRILLWGYTPRLRLFGCLLCSFRTLMTVAPSSQQSDNR